MASTPSSQSAAAVPSPSTHSTAPEPDPETPREFTASGIIALFVRKKRKKFEIHKDLLVAKSKYFKAALAADWEEGKSNEVYWDDEDVEAVSVFVDWLYGRDVCLLGLTPESLILCYELAHKRDIMTFKNDVVDAFRKRFADSHSACYPGMVQYSNKRGLSDTPLHTCILRSVTRSMLKKSKHFLEREDLVKQLDCILEDRDSCRQVMNGILRCQSERWPNPHRKKGCCYHDHSDGQTCEREESN